ncbi:MAG: iron-containing alcohol dehydrogenase [Deltaproteobacteria bacterium]|nr:iron-containing alcohol dehydrogenase [Deltaproteobacteria bacterium]
MAESDVPDLRKFLAPEFIFGVGARRLAGRYARNFGSRKALVVTDPGVVRAGWAQDVLESLDGEGIEHVVFSGVTPNPKAEEVMRGVEFARTEECDLLVAVGGGSPMDCAKGIGVVLSNRGHILDFVGVDQIKAPMPPLICVPTTGGTSADLSQFAIITDRLTATKFAIISKAVVPDVSLVDPLTLTTMPAELSAQTGMDALVHAIEAFVSRGRSEVTDLHALEAVRLVAGNLEASIRKPMDVELRTKVMRASLNAGLAFSNASLGAVHAMAHGLGGLLDLPHGECNALLLEHVVAFNYPEAEERFRQIALAMGLDLGGMVPSAVKRAVENEIRRLKAAVGLDRTLRADGVGRSDIPELACRAVRDPTLVTNPRRATQRDLEVIYEESL